MGCFWLLFLCFLFAEDLFRGKNTEDNGLSGCEHKVLHPNAWTSCCRRQYCDLAKRVGGILEELMWGLCAPFCSLVRRLGSGRLNAARREVS